MARKRHHEKLLITWCWQAIAIVQTGLIGASVKHGLGRHFDFLSDGSIAGYHKVSILDSLHRVTSRSNASADVLCL